MKNALRLPHMISLALILTFACSFSFAHVNTDRTVEKARKAVSNAANDDWKTFAKAANVCIKKGINMDESLTWIEKSISINSNVTNLELLGDYYYKIGNNRQAMISYIEAIKSGKSKDVYFNAQSIEVKIAQARK